MPLVKPNWDDAASFDVPEDGTYEALVDTSEAELFTSKKGEDYVKIKLVIGDYTLDQPIMLAGKGLKYAEEFWRALGYEGRPEIFNTDDWHGRPIRVKVKKAIDENNRQQASVVAYLPPQGTTIR